LAVYSTVLSLSGNSDLKSKPWEALDNYRGDTVF